MGRQSGDGRWIVPHGAIPRPPIEDSDITRTALAIGALKTYGAPGRAADFNERIARASGWLAAAKATAADDRNMQLVGLQRAGADKALLKGLAKAILATQRPDGGWAQRAEFNSDAYATGQTLYALAATEVVSPSDPAYQKGVKYLLSTQYQMDRGTCEAVRRSSSRISKADFLSARSMDLDDGHWMGGGRARPRHRSAAHASTMK